MQDPKDIERKKRILNGLRFDDNHDQLLQTFPEVYNRIVVQLILNGVIEFETNAKNLECIFVDCKKGRIVISHAYDRTKDEGDCLIVHPIRRSKLEKTIDLFCGR